MITFWLTVGILLTVIEFIVPGAIAVFLGLGALTTVALVYFGFIDTWANAFLSWFILSLTYLLFIRSFALRLFAGDEQIENTDEDAAAIGTIVDVCAEVSPAKAGRIRYLDSTWDAYATQTLKPGESAVLVARRGNGWVVKPIDY